MPVMFEFSILDIMLKVMPLTGSVIAEVTQILAETQQLVTVPALPRSDEPAPVPHTGP